MPSISKFGRNRTVTNNTTEDITTDGGTVYNPGPPARD